MHNGHFDGLFGRVVFQRDSIGPLDYYREADLALPWRILHCVSVLSVTA